MNKNELRSRMKARLEPYPFAILDSDGSWKLMVRFSRERPQSFSDLRCLLGRHIVERAHAVFSIELRVWIKTRHPIGRGIFVDGVENLLLQVYTHLPRLDESFVHHKSSSL